MKLLAVGVTVGLSSRRFINDVGPVPPSYRGNTVKEQDWLATNREKRSQNLHRLGWITSITRMVFADGDTFEILYDTDEERELMPVVAAYNALRDRLGVTVDADNGISAVLYGWRLREIMRVWGTELLSYIAAPKQFAVDTAGITKLPLAFWYRPKNVVSVRNMLLASHEKKWVSIDDVSVSLGRECNIDAADCRLQLGLLSNLSKLLDLPTALSSKYAGTYYNDEFNFDDLVS